MVSQSAIDEEAAIIASTMLEPWRLPELSGRITAQMFQSGFHASAWRAMESVGGELPLDDVVAGMAKDGFGGQFTREWFNKQTAAIAFTDNHDYYLDPFIERVRKAGLKQISVDAIAKLNAAAKAPSTTLDDLTALVGVTLDALHSHAAPIGAKAGPDALRDYMRMVESGGDPRISTCYTGLDAFGAFVPGGLYTLAARSGEGKSSLVANFANRMAAAAVPFGLVTVEMTEHQMVNSIIGVNTGINRKNLLGNNLTASQREQRDDAVAALAGQWHIADRDGMTVEQIVAQARAWVRREGIKVLMVDHLQRIRATDTTVPRHLQVGHITWALKGLARSESIVVLLAVQINREGAREGVPKLHHLKESGSVEEDSDGVIAIYVDRAKNSMDSTTWDAELWWLKNRHGAIGTCPITFEKTSGRMTEPPRQTPDFHDPRGGK